MQCPIKGCDNKVEPGPNCRIQVTTADKKKRKLVCNDCAEAYMYLL